MARLIVLSLLLCGVSFCLSAAEFQDFQAARAVIGQSSFSSRDKGFNARALSLGKGNLYAADGTGHLLGFDLSRGAAPGCPVCIVTPQSNSLQNVFDGVAAVAVNGRNIAIADAKGHRVLLWSGDSTQSQPNVILSGFINPVAVALDNQRLFVADAGSHHIFIWNQLPASGSQLSDVTLGVSDSYETGADTIESPSALASDGINLYVADSAAHRILVFSTGDDAAPEVLNAATLTGGPLAPGTLISIEHAANSDTVFMNGSPLKVTDTSGGQLQLQIPYDLNSSTAASVWIQNATGSSRAAALHFVSVSPGIFAFGSKEPRTGMVLHAPEGIPLSPDTPGKPSELVTAWATGLGAVSSEANSDGSFDVLTPVMASVNGVPVEVVSASLPPDTTGVYEVRLRLPARLSRSATLVLMQNESTSNRVTFPVQSKL